MARVEVKAFESPADERRVMEVAWMEDGEATFHDICWKAVIDSYKTDNPFTLIPREKEMIKEAWKTAEYFDSADKIAHEAKRIANMLRAAKYAIAFTGNFYFISYLWFTDIYKLAEKINSLSTHIRLVNSTFVRVLQEWNGRRVFVAHLCHEIQNVVPTTGTSTKYCFSDRGFRIERLCIVFVEIGRTHTFGMDWIQ